MSAPTPRMNIEQARNPTMDIVLVEPSGPIAPRSTDGWNNAGTGHAGYCELN